MEEQDNPESLRPVDRDAAFSVPGTYVDTWFLTTWTGHIRISLGEISRTDGPDHYRFAVVLENGEARKLIKDMTEMLESSTKRDGKEKGAL